MHSDPPLPNDAAEAARVHHARLRRRLMSGTWREDLASRMRRNLGNVRAEAIGEPDMSANPFEATCTGSSALYDLTPKIINPDAPSVTAMAGWTQSAQLWPMMARNQAMCLAQRELLLKVSVTVDDGRPEVVYTPVYADLALIDADPTRPSRPARVRHALERMDPMTGRSVWTWDEWSILGEPVYRILAADCSTDVSTAYGLPAGGLRGEDYPARRSDGRAILPFALYHAAVTGYLLDPYYRRELVEGNLNVGVLWTFFGHCVRAASWPQRYLIGGAIASERSEHSVRRIVADPATILEVLADPTFEGQPSAGQWGSASDPKAVAEAIGLYEARFTAYAGMDPADLQRTSGDPRSGYALAISQEGRIRAQRRYAPVFAPSDAETLAITAALINGALGFQAVAEDGWGVEYTALPPSTETLESKRKETLELLDKRLITRAEARASLLGETPDQAAQALLLVDAEGSKASPFAEVGLPSLVEGGIISTAAARSLLGVDETAAPSPEELMAIRNPATAERDAMVLDALDEGDTEGARAILTGTA